MPASPFPLDSLPTFDAPPGGRLSPEMLAAYDSHGVILLRDFASAQACARLRERALQLVEAMDLADICGTFSTTSPVQHSDRYFIESGDKIRVFLEEGATDSAGRLRQAKADSLNKMGHAMHDLDPVFEAFSRTSELAEVVRRLGIKEPGILQSMYIFKPPRIGGEVICHQDSTYLYTDPESCVGFWFALEDAALDNGCLHFIPGVHKQPLRQRTCRGDDARLTVQTLDARPLPAHEKLAAEAKVGTLAIFSGRTPHMSDANRSSRSRHAYTLHVIDRRCHYPASNWLQRGPDMPLRGFC